MWAVARLDSYPAPGHLDALLATLPPQIESAEPMVGCSHVKCTCVVSLPLVSLLVRCAVCISAAVQVDHHVRLLSKLLEHHSFGQSRNLPGFSLSSRQ